MVEPESEPRITFSDPPKVAFDLETFTQQVLEAKSVFSGSFEFTFVSKDEIQLLNQKHLSRRYSTDILTFNLADDSSDDIIGDVYICSDQARENADAFDNTFDDEIKLLIVHGILHLLDYRDYTEAEKKLMTAEQTRILGLVDAS